jgi:hypothetical protein
MNTMHNRRDSCMNEKDGKDTAKFCAARKGGKKPNPARQTFVQLSKKLDKLVKSLKKLSLRSKKCRRDDSASISE